MKRITFILASAVLALGLAGQPTVSFAKSGHAATGVGKDGTPPGQAQKAGNGTAKDNAPGHLKKTVVL